MAPRLELIVEHEPPILDFLQELEDGGYMPDTIIKFYSLLRRSVENLLGTEQITKVSFMRLTKWVEKLSVLDRTKVKYRAMIREFWMWLKKKKSQAS